VTEHCSRQDVGLLDFYKEEGVRNRTFGIGWQTRIDHLKEFLVGSSFLDVGCAEGLHLQLVHEERRIEYAVGVDISSPKLARALKNARFSHNYLPNFVNDSWDFLPFKNEIFDTVIWFDGPEHCVHPIESLKEIARVTRQNFIISIPTSLPLLLTIEHLQTTV